jgi:hypothetical protein
MKSAHELALTEALALLARARTAKDAASVAELALPLSRALLTASASSTEAHERERAERLSALMDDRAGQMFATALTDRVQRTTSGERVVGAVRKHRAGARRARAARADPPRRGAVRRPSRP